MRSAVVIFSTLCVWIFFPINANACTKNCIDHCRRCVGPSYARVCGQAPSCLTACEIENAACSVTGTSVTLPNLSPQEILIQDVANKLADAIVHGHCAGPLSTYLETVNVGCANSAERVGNQNKVNDAKKILIDNNFFSAQEFNNINVRYCDLQGYATGMVPNKGKILLDNSTEHLDIRLFASLLGHEMVHIRQNRNWGEDGFRCRYSEQLVVGKGFGRANYIEREAYEYEDQMRSVLSAPAPDASNRRYAGGRLTMRWSSAGPVSGSAECVQWLEAADPHTWSDNYLCFDQKIGAQWSSAGPIAGMRCTHILESADPHTWNDNWFCVPHNYLYSFYWSSAGPIAGGACTQIKESADPHTWTDNYLCTDAR